MNIQCECGKFKAELQAFPNHTPGRLICYCDDCQAYMHHLGRADLLDSNGGTEIIPAYPCDVKILSGKENLKCLRLSDKGMYRFYTSCCKTPIGNTRANDPWIGFHRRVYTVKDGTILDNTLGAIRARIMGRFAKGTPPSGTPKTFNFKGFKVVMPFMLKGKLMKKFKNSPFFKEDGKTPIVPEQVLGHSEFQAALKTAGFTQA